MGRFNFKIKPQQYCLFFGLFLFYLSVFSFFKILTINVTPHLTLKKVAIIYKSLYIISNKLYNKIYNKLSGGH